MGTHPIFESDFDCLTEKMKLISSILLLNAVNCMYFYLEPGTKKCIKEEIHKDVVVTGEYEITESPNHKVDLKVLIQKSTFYIIKKKPKKESLLLLQTIKTCLKSVSSQTKKE